MPKANVNGTTLHYELTGPDTGIPIVFIHPPLLTLEAFTYQKEQLGQYFRVITFDIRGHGASACSERKLTYSLIADDIIHLLDHLAVGQAFVCGYSTGGSVALEAMLAYPSRLTGGIIVSGMSELTDTYNRCRVWLAIRMAKTRRFMKFLINAITYGNADKATTYHVLKEHSLSDEAGNVRTYFEQSLHYSCTSRLSLIKQPTLLIYGLDDPVFHQYAHILHTQLPQSSLYFIKDAKHPVPLQSAPRMNDLIHLWVDSLKEGQQNPKRRGDLDLAIAQRLNPHLYGKYQEHLVDAESDNTTYSYE
ncbi:hypothetical protein A8709_07800 [Paenibacillus pectinilyticus]|uniref:AB hydrolase-1 domain-containing protein n=1 Tax=Paenibacillus pectinilyticus TaxID=512399 RepID=A0A1C1A7J0_9BACL|nr:hypothetical protein A8709_07800 [Paenibacillus pectinilyticus]